MILLANETQNISLEEGGTIQNEIINPTNREKKTNEQQKPLLKWAGGKRSLLKYILPMFPVDYNRFFEPFLGGGAVFFALQPNQSTVADNNRELINCYQQVRDNPVEVLRYLQEMRNTQEDYYLIRRNTPVEKSERAARIIYLTTLSFNGIYRENLKGEFNVPYGKKDHLNPYDPDRIMQISEFLKTSDIRCQDFEETVNDATRGDLVYFDPPYTKSSGDSGFIKYHSTIFTWEDQVRLSNVARELAERGCSVFVSNASHDSIIELYHDFDHRFLERPSVIAASGEFRGTVQEIIFYKRG